MLDIQEIEQNLLNATGKFEYTVDDGAVVVPAYKYAHFDPAGGDFAVFVGRSTSVAYNETGVFIGFKKMPEFWGVDVPLGENITATYKQFGYNWENGTGTVTGFFRTSEQKVFIQFDFVAHRNSDSKRIKGYCILSV
jgi:hypothetical protein